VHQLAARLTRPVAGRRSAKYFNWSDVEVVQLVDFTDCSGLKLPSDLR
jgi:hypothetical protein